MPRAKRLLAAQLDWAELERALAGEAGRRARGIAGHHPEIEAAFDEAELRDLRRLARRAVLTRAHQPPLGNVVFLHGITGADLASIDAGGDVEGIWVNAPRLILGRIERLKLDPTAKREADARFTVKPTGINGRYYARGVLALRARWNVETFAYDWRKDLDAASDGLAVLIRNKFPGQPVHLVAHSMGGLVARNLVRRHSRLWDAIAASDLVAGGRLVMLGTPNYGSFAIPPVLTGGDQMMEVLERLDLAHNMPQLLAITNTFLGSYMLLPAPGKLSAALQSLYHAETWGSAPGISQAHLDRTWQFYHDLESAPTIDPRRMSYVAGCRHATLASMRIVAPGEFDYELSYAGDGRVPHELGLLPGVPTWYVDEVHGDLARNEQVLRAVDELLESGRTSELGTAVLRVLERAAPTMRDYRSAADRRLLEELDRIAAKAHAAGGPDTLSLAEQQLAADALVRAALGTGARALPKAALEAARGARRHRPAGVTPVALQVELRFADVREVKAPLVVVGHYRGVPPSNAIGALDAALDGWLARAVKQGMINGALGETFFLPSFGRIAADALVVAGMGDFGRFTPSDLRLLMANVATGAGAMGCAAIACVLVGTGEGNLELDVALQELLEGLGTGLQQLHQQGVQAAARLRNLVIVEHDGARFLQIAERLATLRDADALSSLRLALVEPGAGDLRRARAAARSPRRSARAPSAPSLAETRLTVERPAAGETFRFSALTRSAVAPVREVDVNLQYATGAAEALRSSRTREEQEKFGRLLYTYLMPEDLHAYVDTKDPLRLVVDRSTAAFPWEMACFPTPERERGLRWLGTDLRLSRQFRTLLARAPGISPTLNDRVRALVIADPAPEPELHLRGARLEGRRVAELLKAASGRIVDGRRLEIDVEQRIGPSECDPVEILAMLLSGDFDLVHFAGHGDYDPANPDKAGWVFGEKTLLTARDIFQARKVPRLVFANACLSGVVHEGVAFDASELSSGIATIAQAFFERGVPNYVGSGWPVDDAQALTMADRFYGALLRRFTIGAAMFEGRRAIFDEGIESTWGAYQHYGDPNDRLFRP